MFSLLDLLVFLVIIFITVLEVCLIKIVFFDK